MYALTRFALDHQRLTLTLLALTTIAFATGLPRLQHAYGYTAIVGAEHPVIQTLEDMVVQFGGGIPARIRWECGEGQPCASALDRTSLEMADALSAQLSRIEGVRKVYGVSNTGLLVPAPGGFAVRQFVLDGVPAADAERLAPIAAQDPLWAGTLVSRDLRAGTLFVVPRAGDHQSELALVTAIEAAIAPQRARGFQFHVVGGPVDGVVAGRDLSRSTARIIPLTVLLTALVLFFLFRTWQDVVSSLCTMGVALLWTYGALAWLGWPQDGILEVLAPLIMVVGVCDSVHLLSRHAEQLQGPDTESHRPTRSRLLVVAREIGGACFITTATTAAAFLSFTASGLASFQRFGAISAFGVVTCLLLTFSLLPILVSRLPRPSGIATLRTQERWTAGLNAIAGLTERHSLGVLALSIALLLVGGGGWYTQLRVDTNWDDSLGERSSLVQARRFEERHGFASNELEIELTMPEGVLVQAPETLARVEAFARAAEALPLVRETKSVVALISQLNRLLHDDDPAFERPGESLAANAEILELIAFDDPDMLALWLNLDQTRLRLTTNNHESSAMQMGELLQDVRSLATEQLGPEWGVRMSGNTAVTYEWTRDVQLTQVRSFPIALVLVFVIVLLFLRSPSLALAALVPAVLPIVATLGTMGWAGLSLDMGRAMIAAVLLGIAVDDGIHLLGHYQLRRNEGDEPNTAIRSAVLHVGRAIITTSLSLSLGFLTLAASAWQSISSFGLFIALAILVALAAALTTLPALVLSSAAAFRFVRAARLHPAIAARASRWRSGGSRAKKRLDLA